MSHLATLINSVITNSAPPYNIVLWEDTVSIPANSDSTSLIILEIPGLAIDEPSYRQSPRKSTNGGVCYAMRLSGFSVSCSSTNFNVRMVNINDMSKLNTIYELLRYNNINLATIDEDFEDFIIRNRDISLTNKLYLYIENNDAVNATGSISIELTYINMQDRLF